MFTNKAHKIPTVPQESNPTHTHTHTHMHAAIQINKVSVGMLHTAEIIQIFTNTLRCPHTQFTAHMSVRVYK